MKLPDFISTFLVIAVVLILVIIDISSVISPEKALWSCTRTALLLKEEKREG